VCCAKHQPIIGAYPLPKLDFGLLSWIWLIDNGPRTLSQHEESMLFQASPTDNVVVSLTLTKESK